MRKIILYTSIFVLAMVFYACKEAPKKEAENPGEIEKIVPEEIEVSQLDLINDEIIEKPNSPNGYYKRAMYYKSVFDFPKALEDINRALKVTPKAAELNYAKGDILFNKAGADQDPKLYESAVVYLKEAIEIDSTHTNALIVLARINMGIPNLEEAMRKLDQAIRNDVYNSESYFWKGMVFMLKGEVEKAASSYQTAIELDAYNIKAFNHLGLIYADKFDPVALDYYNSALAIDPDNFEVLRNKGLHLKDMEDYTGAIETFNILVAEDQTYAEGYYNIGNTYIAMYRDDMSKLSKDTTMSQAIAYFEQAVIAFPEYTNAIYNIGHVYDFKGEKAKAKEYYLKVLEIDENNKLALDALNK